MTNLLKKWRQRREEKTKLRELKQLSSVFTSLEKMMQAGLLYWNEKQRQLMITQPLAVPMMQTAEKWQAFIRNVYLWSYHKQASEAWEKFMQKEELKAVRRSISTAPLPKGEEDLGSQPAPIQPTPGHQLTREDIDRIKRARRAEIAQSDMQPPRVEGFEFFIVADTTDAQPKVLAVGHYDPDTDSLEMATWEEVSRFLEN